MDAKNVETEGLPQSLLPFPGLEPGETQSGKEAQKRCSKCTVVFPATDAFFHRQSDTKTGLTKRCRWCINEKVAAYNKAHAQQRNEREKERHKQKQAAKLQLRMDMPPAPTRTCTKCRGEFPPTFEFFYRQPRGKFGLKSTCRLCEHAKAKRYSATHPGERTTWVEKKQAMRSCTRCLTAYPMTPEFFPRRALSKEGLDSRCKECVNAMQRAYYLAEENAEKKRARQKSAREKARHKEIAALAVRTCKKCQQSFPGTLEFFYKDSRTKSKLCPVCKTCRDTYNRIYHSKHKIRIAAQQKGHRKFYAAEVSESGRAWYSKKKEINEAIRQEMVLAYGGKCACCGETQHQLLTIDHIFGGGTEHRKQLGGGNLYKALKNQGWPKDLYRLYCMSCNWSARFTGMCAHKQETIPT